MSELRVYARHVRGARICMNGAREWCASQPGLNWGSFLTEGVPVDTLSALNDPFANRAVAVAKAEAEESRHGRRR